VTPSLFQPSPAPAEVTSPSPPSSSLDPPETSVDPSSLSIYRAAVLAAFQAANVPYSRRANFQQCGKTAIVLRSRADPTLYKVAPCLCHDRFCPRCQTVRSERVVANMKRREPPSDLRFVTLTLRHNHDSLAQRVAFLRTAFRRLRARRDWKHHVTGGIAFLEISYDSAGHAWHPHFHCIISGGFFDQRLLADNWLACTGDSSIVDIRRIRKPADALAYVTKYASAVPTAVVKDDPAALLELVIATRSGRFVQPFGTWIKAKLLADPNDHAWTRIAWEAEIYLDPLLPHHVVLALIAAIEAWHRGSNDTLIRIPDIPPFVADSS